MTETPTRVERFTRRVRSNPIVATCIVLGFVVVWFASFTEAVRKLQALWPTTRPPIAGRWQSAPLKDVRTQLDYHYVFDLKSEGSRVFGSARRRVPYCETHPTIGLCDGHGREVAVLDGAQDRQQVSFACDWGELPAGSAWAWVRVKETFRGTVADGAIRFVAQDDRNNPPTEFSTTLQARS